MLTSFRSFHHAPDFIRSNLTNSKNLNFISNAFSFFRKEKKIPLTLLWCWYDDWLFFFRNRKSLPFSLSKPTLLLKHTSETSFIPLQINILLLLSGGTLCFHGETMRRYCVELMRLERHWRYWFDYSLPHPSHEENHVILMSWWSYMCSNQKDRYNERCIYG